MSDSLAQALVAAQAEMPTVAKRGLNPHFKNNYVTLDDLLEAVRPVLNRHGIVLVQLPTHIDGAPALETCLIGHGERISATMPLVLAKNDMQGMGGAITYGRRYMLASMLGIAEMTDDDGNQASRPPDARVDPELPVPKSAAEVETAWLALGLDAVWLAQAREVKPKPSVQKMGTVLHRLWEQGPRGPIGNWEKEQVQAAFAAVLDGAVLDGPEEMSQEELDRMTAKVLGEDPTIDMAGPSQ